MPAKDYLRQEVKHALANVIDHVEALHRQVAQVRCQVKQGRLPRLNTLGEFQDVSLLEAKIGKYMALRDTLEDLYPEEFSKVRDGLDDDK